MKTCPNWVVSPENACHCHGEYTAIVRTVFIHRTVSMYSLTHPCVHTYIVCKRRTVFNNCDTIHECLFCFLRVRRSAVRLVAVQAWSYRLRVWWGHGMESALAVVSAVFIFLQGGATFRFQDIREQGGGWTQLDVNVLSCDIFLGGWVGRGGWREEYEWMMDAEL